MEKNWTAFLRLAGKTSTEKADRIVEDLDRFVQSMRSVDIDYNIIVFFEDQDPRMVGPLKKMQGRETELLSKRRGA